MIPTRLFLLSPRIFKYERFIREEGKLPEILFPLMPSNCNKGTEPNVLGISPDKLLQLNCKTFKLDHFSQHSGITPDN
ncbi:hypothetical protein HanXRQr2_Chr07g0315351 [Helianthus annuus]|uniref:Uncharacterized protein n=1 Tax=Helianthus annuus TaxID=4232 RepID=A0A9K3NHC2_HELAN|nr:hypothetical protein HanXRQr2_Chr07g0315351 [Helianthus annuus]